MLSSDILGQPRDGAGGRDEIKTGSQLSAPSHDVSVWLERLGCKLFPRDRPLIQYVAWAYELGLLRVLSGGPVSLHHVTSHTRLNDDGADALLGVLCAIRIAARTADGDYTLNQEARDYFSPTSAFFIGNELYARGEPIPRSYLAGAVLARTWIKLIHLLPSMRFGTSDRLLNQHVRNLPACIAASRSGEFDDVECLVDIAGGSGAFAIPLALEYPTMRVVLSDLPATLKNVGQFIANYGLGDRIELHGMNAFEFPWEIPECDAIFLGNFLHGFQDGPCLDVCQESLNRLEPGGKIYVHEMLWNTNRDGPLITALWNASMRAGGGKQRTAAEFTNLLERVGFESPYVIHTAGAFALVVAGKPD